jgi:hypothetical protein
VAPIEDTFDEDQPSKRRGRPRIWESEAERKRAYRERKAVQLAYPERLREQLQNERRRVAYRDRELARARAELGRAVEQLDASVRRQETLQRTIDKLEIEVEKWRSRTKELAHHRTDEADRTRRRRR